MKLIYTITVITLINFTTILCKNNDDSDLQLPYVPCPDIFRYLNVNSEWIGVIELDNILSGQIYKLIVNLAFDDYLNDNKFGKLDLLYDHEKTLNHILFSNRVAYRIRFPVSNLVPRIQKITLNQRIICEGQPEVYEPITKIQLDHTLKTTYTTYPVSETVGGSNFSKSPYYYNIST